MKEKGITLIALVITIIVLIILAGVSIAMLTGDNGILSQAQRAKEENRAGTVKDRVAIWKAETQMMDPEEEGYTTRDEMMWDLYKEGLLTKLELNIGKYQKTIQIASQTIDFGEDDGVKKIKVMEKPPEITDCGQWTYDLVTKLQTEDNLKEVPVQKNENVNEVFTSNDSILKLTVSGGNIYGENCLDDGIENDNSSEWGAFSVEFSTNSKEIIFSTNQPTRIFVDEGEGYKATNEDGLNKEMLTAMGYDRFWQMTFSDKKDRNIKFEISKGGCFGMMFIEKDAIIKKVENKNVKKAMFIGDRNSFQVKLSNTGMIQYHLDYVIA